MATYSAQIKQALLSQSTLINEGEHCSADLDQLKTIDRAKGHQIRVKRNNDEYALYTVMKPVKNNQRQLCEWRRMRDCD